MRTTVRSSVAGPAVTASLFINASTFIDTPDGRIIFTSKYTCVSEKVVYAIKSRACHKICIGETGRRLLTDLGNIYAPRGYQFPIFLLDAILLYRTHNSEQAGFCNPFGG